METLEITKEEHIVTTRIAARNKASELGLSVLNKTRVATAVSELARNVYTYGGGGRMDMDVVEKDGRKGLRCVFVDQGPGIADIEQAMRDGFSTGKGLGHGLPGAKRLMDHFKIESELGKGKRVEVIKWK